MKRHLGSLTVVLAAVAAVVVLKSVGPRAAARGEAYDPPPLASYEAACKGDPASARCALLHGAMRARVLELLDLAEQQRDQRNVDAVVGYFDLAGEPEIHEAAARVVAASPTQAAVARARPLLFTDHFASQRAGARLLEQSTDPTDRHLAAQWQKNHKSLGAGASPYDRQPRQPDPARVGLTAYPGAQRWAPGDSMTAIGLATTDPLQRVVDFYARATKTTAVGADAWQRRREGHEQVQSRAVQAEIPDMRKDADYQEVQRLAKEYQRTRDPALIARIQEVSQRIEQKGKQLVRRMEDAQTRTGAGLLQSYEVPGTRQESPWRTARVFVVEQRGSRVVRLVAVYREETLGKTIVQLAWDPVAYPVVPAVR